LSDIESWNLPLASDSQLSATMAFFMEHFDTVKDVVLRTTSRMTPWEWGLIAVAGYRVWNYYQNYVSKRDGFSPSRSAYLVLDSHPYLWWNCLVLQGALSSSTCSTGPTGVQSTLCKVPNDAYPETRQLGCLPPTTVHRRSLESSRRRFIFFRRGHRRM